MDYWTWGTSELIAELDKRDAQRRLPPPIVDLAGYENQILELIYDASEETEDLSTSDLQGRVGAIVLGAYQLGKQGSSPIPARSMNATYIFWCEAAGAVFWLEGDAVMYAPMNRDGTADLTEGGEATVWDESQLTEAEVRAILTA